MAQHVLLVRAELRHAPAVGKLEYRVVTEAPGTGWLVRDAALYDPFGQALDALGVDQGYHAAEAGGALLIGHPREALQQEPVAVGRRGIGARPAVAVHARLAP